MLATAEAECQGNYCNHVFSLTLQSAKSDNDVIVNEVFRTHMIRHFLRRTFCVTLILSLLAPGLGATQQPAPVLPVPATSVPVRGSVPVPIPPGSRTIPGPDYRLGVGDVLDVQIAGRLEVIRSQVVVDLEGAINVPPIGSVPLAGLTLLEAHRRVAERARAVYKFVEVTVAVVAPRAFEITVSGEVERPGTMIVTATRRLREVILDAGGI